MALMTHFKSAVMTLAVSACLSGCQASSEGLEAVHADIVKDLPQVEHVSAEDMLRMRNPVLLDIRDPSEYAVSHIDGAILISPDIDQDELLSRIGDISNKDIVLYCSVGRRSSILADRMNEIFIAEGASSVSNLERGLFGWHNDRRELVNTDGPTDAIHPYNEFWKRHVTRKDKAVYVPQ